MGRDRIETERKTQRPWRGRAMAVRYSEPFPDRTPPRPPADRDDIPMTEAEARFEVVRPTWRDAA
jgi:hypothetical protein